MTILTLFLTNVGYNPLPLKTEDFCQNYFEHFFRRTVKANSNQPERDEPKSKV